MRVSEGYLEAGAAAAALVGDGGRPGRGEDVGGGGGRHVGEEESVYTYKRMASRVDSSRTQLLSLLLLSSFVHRMPISG